MIMCIVCALSVNSGTDSDNDYDNIKSRKQDHREWRVDQPKRVIQIEQTVRKIVTRVIQLVKTVIKTVKIVRTVVV